MPTDPLHFARRIIAELRRAISGPQGLAFLPAITLAAFWLGGEGLLLAAALGVPGLIAAASLLTRSNRLEEGYDRLTGLPGRDRFEKVIDEIILNSPSCGGATACLAIGIDDHARMSSRLGREAADNVLSGVADRVLGALRDSDVVARLDGDVLAVALSPNKRTDLETLIRVAGRIQSALTEPFSVDGVKIFVAASVGIAPPTRLDRPSGARLVEAALTALAAARGEASGAIRTYSDTMAPAASARADDNRAVATALEAGEIGAWYQPIVDMRTRQVLGFEALARWTQPDGGVLGPDAFLDQIGSAGLSQRLTEMMFYDACMRAVAWDQSGLDVARIWLNLSRDDLLNPKLPEKTEKELSRFDLEGARFGFDVTEDALRAGNDTVIGRNLRALSQLGCDVVLDQFGTAPVALQELRAFSVRSIKIDRSLIRAIDRDPGQAALFEACLDVAGRLDLATIAVGIENAAEFTRAEASGCDALQGRIISGAMAADDIPQWLRDYRAQTPVAALPLSATSRSGMR